MKGQRLELLRSLSKTWVVQRLKHIDLSVVPRWLGPLVPIGSRYQHSIAVGKLSLLVSGGTEHDQLLLTASAVLHDVGNGPFPHISDRLMEEMLGFRHEGSVKFTFENSPVNDSLVLEDYGLGLDEVSAVVRGGHKLSPLVNGRPDLDNADNIYRGIMTIPGKPLGEPSYRPSEIAASMSLETGKTELSENLRRRWLADREKGYSYLWENRLNMVCWTMLGRTLRIMKDEITPRFFLMTNRQAFDLIKLRLPKLARGLKNNQYKIVLDRSYSLFKGEASKFLNPKNLGKVEEELCSESGLEDEFLGLTVDQPNIKVDDDHWRVYLVVYEGIKKPLGLLEDILFNSEPFPHQN